MITVEELKDMVLYKKQFILPFDSSDRRKKSLIFLISPNAESSNGLMNLPYALNKANTFHSYFVERNANYYINQEGMLEQDTDSLEYIHEMSEDELDAMEGTLNG